MEGDWELLESWCNGDADAGEKLVVRYLGLLTRFFRNKVGNPDNAADLISETMLVCTRNKEHIRESEAFRSFLFGIAMNVLRRYYDKKTKRSRELDDFEEICVGEFRHPRSVSSLISLEEESRLLVRALRRIPLDQQIVLELSYFESMRGTEIAELIGVPSDTVYTRLRRGKERLRVVMSELTNSPELVESTMMGLNTWAEKIREKIER